MGGDRYDTGGLDSVGPVLAQTDFGQCRHERLWKHGFSRTRNPRQMYQCAFCLQQFVENARDNRLTRIKKLAPLFLAGLPIQRAEKLSGYNWKTVKKYYRIFQAASIASIARSKSPPVITG